MDWDERYSIDDYLFGQKPAQALLRNEEYLVPRGETLLIADGEGRNSVYLAKNGFKVTSFLNFNLIWNEGIAFGLLSFDQKLYYNFLTIIIILVTIIIILMIIKTKGLEKIAFMMIFGGSLGNIFDRLVYASVPDFIDLHFNNFNWFIFNVADIFISVGVILLIYYEFFNKRINE